VRSGGGAVLLTVTNSLSLTGSILADGAGGAGYGPSGGSIYIQAGYLVGGGTLTANGVSGTLNYGGGGGGIAVVASSLACTGGIHAYGGTGSSQAGAAGTIFLKGPGANGTLLID